MHARSSANQHIFTVDVEEYFHAAAFDDVVSRDSWDGRESRVEPMVDLLLDMLAGAGAVGTFFTLGWLAERRPDLVRRIAAAGHEIASHSWWHRRVFTLTPAEFRDDARRSKDVLEQATGARVFGYRAPSFSIVPGTEWALHTLREVGYLYDSSLFPIRRPGYGYAAAPAQPHTIRCPAGDLLELPLATTRVAGLRLPAAGGGYLRQLPLWLTQRAFREHTGRGATAVFYIHPWELDPGQPRLPVSWLTRVRHYRGLARTRERIAALLAEFRWTSVERAFQLGTAAALPRAT